MSKIAEICLNPGSPQEHKKNYLVQGNLMRTSLHGPMTLKVMQKNVWRGIASWPIKATEQLYKVATRPTTGRCHYCLARMCIGPDLKRWPREESSGGSKDALCVRLSRFFFLRKNWPSMTTLAATHAQPTVSDTQNEPCGGIMHPLRELQSKTCQRRNMWAVGPDVKHHKQANNSPR